MPSLHYLDETTGDLDVITGRTGPQLALSDESDGPTIRPFVDATYIRSGSDFLYFSGGGGIELQNPLDGDTLLFGKAGLSYRDFNRAQSDNDGFTYYAEGGLQKRVQRNTILRGALFGLYDDTKEEFHVQLRSRRTVEHGAQLRPGRRYRRQPALVGHSLRHGRGALVR